MTDTPAAYLRTSLEDFNRAHGLADQSQSISNQRKVILEYVQHNPEFSEVQIREFIDDGLTGTNTDRPQFQAMIEAARRGEVKCIIVKDFLDLAETIWMWATIWSTSSPFWGSGSSRSTMAMTANSMRQNRRDGYCLSQFHVRKLQPRSFHQGPFRNALPHEKGAVCQSCSYGYQKAPGDKHLMVPDPNTAPHCPRDFPINHQGKSTSQIAKELNTRGVLTPLAYKQHRLKPACQNRELMWSHITVLNILKKR